MDLESIVIREEAGRYESLALGLQAVARAADGELDYDALCAAMGVSLAAVSLRSEPAPGWWMTFGRDAFVESAAKLFGIRLRNLHPPDVGVEMVAADEFPQHFEASYKPLILTALGNEQPVLAWQGWPDASAMFWGVVTEAGDAGLRGTTLWAGGERVPLTGPALQCYVVEECDPQDPPRDQLLAMALRHADAYMNRAPLTPVVAGLTMPVLVTGPAAFDAWEEWLAGGEFGATDRDPAWREHRQHAEFLVAARRSAVTFLNSIREIIPSEQQNLVDQLLDTCAAQVTLLGPSCDENGARASFSSPAGRQTLLEAVHRAEAADRRIAMMVEELSRAANASA
ncbi:MAG: hypothetical protein HY718_06590 [Planctomycetes bacterium]|nr:hypothetical protein [Planctomycetota bacterium]